MPSSYKNRRARHKPIDRHRQVIEVALTRICKETGTYLGLHRGLIQEALRFSDPWVMKGRDALLPPHRHDLLKIWLRVCVTTKLTPEEREGIALQLAPAPD